MTTLEEVFLKIDDDSNKEDTEVVFRNPAADCPTENLVFDDGREGPHLSSKDVRVNLSEFDSTCKMDWFGVLWLQLTALLEVIESRFYFLPSRKGMHTNFNCALVKCRIGSQSRS